jgi:hypothetical protein
MKLAEAIMFVFLTIGTFTQADQKYPDVTNPVDVPKLEIFYKYKVDGVMQESKAHQESLDKFEGEKEERRKLGIVVLKESKCEPTVKQGPPDDPDFYETKCILYML